MSYYNQMGKITKNNMQKLIASGKMVPIIRANDKGENFIIGYARKANSRKSRQQVMLQEPQKINIMEPTAS